jgi:hypothetical protein
MATGPTARATSTQNFARKPSRRRSGARGAGSRQPRALKRSRTTTQRYLSVYPAIRELADEEFELALDLAEHSLFVDAAAGEPKARKFLLLTLGRSRGYVLHQEVVVAHETSLGSSQQRNTRLVIDCDREPYLAKLREYAREAQGRVLDARSVPLAGDGHGHNRDVPG